MLRSVLSSFLGEKIFSQHFSEMSLEVGDSVKLRKSRYGNSILLAIVFEAYSSCSARSEQISSSCAAFLATGFTYSANEASIGIS